jgi:uncharacterized protein YjbI with pentapeptide repeats
VGATFDTLSLVRVTADEHSSVPIDLRHTTIRNLELSDRQTREQFEVPLRLDGADIGVGNFDDTAIAEIWLAGADCTTLSFERARIDRGKFEAAEIETGWFRNATLGLVDFDDAVFETVSFEHAELKSVHFAGITSKQEATFRQSVMDAVYFDEAVLHNANFQGATLSDAEFDEATIQTATFQKAVFGPSETDFTGATLRDVEFDLTSFERTKFVGAHLRDVHFTRCEFGHVRVSGAIFLDVVFDQCEAEALESDATSESVGLADETGDPSECTTVYSMKITDSVFEQVFLDDIEFAGHLEFRSNRFGRLRLEPTATGTPIGYVDFRNSHIESGTLHQSTADGAVIYDLGGCTIGDISFRGTEDLLGRIRFFQTKFDGFVFSSQPNMALADVNYKIHRLAEGSASAVSHAIAFSALLSEAAQESTLAGSDSFACYLADKRGEITESSLSTQTGREDSITVADLPSSEATEMAVTDDRDGETTVQWIERPPDYALAPDKLSEFFGSAVTTEHIAEAVLLAKHSTPDPSVLDGIRRAETGSGRRATWRELEATYLDAKNGADLVGDLTAAGKFFYHQLCYRRKHWAHAAVHGEAEEVRNTSKSATDISPSKRIWHATKWARNAILFATTGYGERPFRVVTASVGIICAFGVLYWQLFAFPFAEPENPLLIDYIIFSIQSFVAFLIGMIPQSAPWPVRVASAIEGFIGAFFVALFVFTLTRRIHR